MKFGLAFASSVGVDGEAALESCRRAEAVGVRVGVGRRTRRRPVGHGVAVSLQRRRFGVDDPRHTDPGSADLAGLRGRRRAHVAPRRVRVDRAAAQPTRAGEGTGHPRPSDGWPCRTRPRCRIDARGVRRARHPVGKRRGARTDEYVAAMRALWSGPEVEFHGEFVDFAPLTCLPRPVAGWIPILVGGDTPAALRRAARLADGYFPANPNTGRLTVLLGALRSALDGHGRDPDAIEIGDLHAGPDRSDRVGELSEISVGTRHGAGVLLRRPGRPRPPRYRSRRRARRRRLTRRPPAASPRRT